MVGDTIKLSFYVKDAYKEDWSDDDIRPFSHYAFEVTEQGFKTILVALQRELLGIRDHVLEKDKSENEGI